MKKYILTAGILFFTLFSYAQSSDEARKMLDNLYEVYQQSNGVKFSFVITTIDANGGCYEPQQGEAMMKGNKFKLDMNSATIWFDGKTQWVLLKEANEVNVSNPSSKELAFISPMALLRLYKNGYTLKKPVSETIRGHNAYVIDMVSIASQNDFKHVSVAIDKKTHTILQIKATLENNQQSIIDITDYSDNHHFPDAFFVFDETEYSDVEIVDLR